MVNSRIEITGDKEYQALIAKMKKELPKRLDAALLTGSLDTMNEAKKSIQGHQSSGNVYVRGSITYTASTAGNPPNSDTGNLVQNITIQKIKGGYDVGSRKGAPYGVHLEFGTSKMAARPWLTPAFYLALEKLKVKMIARLREKV
jgi:HK97 gp10 family phage protein